MFKPGQLVQSNVTGLYYVIEDIEYQKQEYLRVSLAHIRSHLFLTSRRGLRLIGNNYRARPKCSR